MEFPEIPDDFFRMLRNRLFKKDDSEFELLGPLSPDDAKEWLSIMSDSNKIKIEAEVIKARNDMVEARKKLFWCRIEESTGIYEKSMRIIGTNLLIEKDKPEKEEDNT